MVSNVNLNTKNYALKDLINLSKYANRVPITDDADKLTVSQVVSYPSMLCAYEGFHWLKNNKGHYKASFKEVAENGKKAHELLKTSGVSGVLRVADAKEILAKVPQAEALGKLSAPVQDLYKKAAEIARAAELNPVNKELIKDASKTIAQAEAKAYAEITKDAKGLFPSISKKLGITKLTQATKDLETKSSVFKKCKDAYDNEAGTFMLTINGIVEATSNVIPTFKQLGFKRGMKQLGRSAVKTVANVAGWVAGSAVGTRFGQILGAAIGNTKVGAVIGAVAGKVGSYAVGTIGEHLTNKGVTKLLGKSEVEKAEEENAIAIAKEAQNNPEVFDALVQKAAERLYEEGEDNAEGKAINQTLTNLVMQTQSQQPQYQTSERMTKEEMKAYADKLKSEDAQTQNAPAKQEYKGYIPSAEAAKIKPETVEVSSAIADVLAKTDRTIEYCNKYVLK